jgi:hypothetical protein
LLFVERASDVVSYGADLHGLVGIEHTQTVSRTHEPQPVR